MRQLEVLIKHTDEFFRRHWPDSIGIPAPQWDSQWDWEGSVPYHDKGGVYALFNDLGDLLYIGLGASVGAGNRVGFGISRRLTGHVITTDKEKGSGHYKPEKNWSDVRAIATIGFLNEYCYLAPALEDYLIGRIDPPRNRSKVRSR